MIADEKFFAWLDGELNSDEAAAVEHEVAADPRLTTLADEHRAMQAQLKGAFNRLTDAAVPEKLNALLHKEQGQVVGIAAARQRQRGRDVLALPQWIAMAATLVIGAFVGTLVQLRDSASVRVENGEVYAASGLADALDTHLASAPASGAVRIGLTFRDQTGAVCRTFIDLHSSGLACHEGSRWQVRGLFAAPEGQSTDYRMAAGMNPNLAPLVDSTMAGEPFDASEERAARKNSWK